MLPGVAPVVFDDPTLSLEVQAAAPWLTHENQAANMDVEMTACTTPVQFLPMLVAGWLQLQHAASGHDATRAARIRRPD